MQDVGEWMDSWVRGWVVSRAAPPPEPIPNGLRVATGTTRELERQVLRSDAALAAAVERVDSTPSWIKYPIAVDAAPDATPTGWALTDRQWLMVARPRTAPVDPLPSGYRIRRRWESGCAVVEVLHGTARAAGGRAGMRDRTSVADQIVTDAAHRRRGLGRVVMGELDRMCARAGATRSVLVASDDGRGLYASLGWTALARVVEMTNRA